MKTENLTHGSYKAVREVSAIYHLCDNDKIAPSQQRCFRLLYELEITIVR